MKLDISSLAEEALHTVWEIAVRHYPEAKTGDLSPLTSFALTQAAEAAIAEWVDNNAKPIRDGGE